MCSGAKAQVRFYISHLRALSDPPIAAAYTLQGKLNPTESQALLLTFLADRNYRGQFLSTLLECQHQEKVCPLFVRGIFCN
jgi:hypothetical protein